MRKFLRSIDFWESAAGARLHRHLPLCGDCSCRISLPGFNLSQLAASASEKALLILPMTLLIITREIDLSVASVLALTAWCSACSCRLACRRCAAIPLTLVAGGAPWRLQRLSGLRPRAAVAGGHARHDGDVSRRRLHPARHRLGQHFAGRLADFGINNLPGTDIPWTIVPFLVLAPVFAVVLQKTPTGRRIYAIGGNPEAARYSGIHITPDAS